MRKSLIILGVSQTISSISVTILIFALMMSSYNNSKSILDLSFVYIATSLPVFLVAPFCGLLIDKFNKKFNLVLADSLCILSIIFLYFNNYFIFLVVFFVQLSISYQGLTNQTLVTLFFNKEKLHMILGWMQFKKALQRLVAPALGGYLYNILDLKYIITISMLSLMTSLISLIFVNIPNVSTEKKSQNNFINNIGLKYILSDKILVYVCIFFICLNFLSGIYSVIYTPILLTFSDEQALGYALSIGSLGMIFASLSSAHIKSLTQKKYQALFLYVFMNGLSEIVMVSYPNFWVYSFGLLFGCISSSYIAVCSNLIWQSNVPYFIQGATFGARDFFVLGALSFGMLIGGIFGDFIKSNYNLSNILILTGFLQLILVTFCSYAWRFKDERLYSNR